MNLSEAEDEVVGQDAMTRKGVRRFCELCRRACVGVSKLEARGFPMTYPGKEK